MKLRETLQRRTQTYAFVTMMQRNFPLAPSNTSPRSNVPTLRIDLQKSFTIVRKSKTAKTILTPESIHDLQKRGRRWCGSEIESPE